MISLQIFKSVQYSRCDESKNKLLNETLLSPSLKNWIQDREHKFRIVQQGTEKVSEITHFAMDCPTRKSSKKKMSLNVQAESIKLYKKTGTQRTQACKCSTEFLKLFKNLSTIKLQGLAYKNTYLCSKTHIFISITFSVQLVATRFLILLFKICVFFKAPLNSWQRFTANIMVVISCFE